MAGQYWPVNGAGQWVRRMYFPEFVFFMNTAAGYNLKGNAADAFNRGNTPQWTTVWEAQYDAVRANYTQAQMSFPDCEDSASGVKVRAYLHSSFGGGCIAVNDYVDIVTTVSGRTFREKFTDGTDANDAISSLKVAPGYAAIVYADAQSGGASMTFRGSVSSLSSFNDVISSISVIPDCGSTAPVKVYEDASFQGGCWASSLNQPDFTTDVFNNNVGMNDRASSVEIAAGWNAVLYQNSRYGGSSHVVTSSASSLPSFNDVASSIKIVRDCTGAHLVRVYQHESFGGQCKGFSADDRALTNDEMDGGIGLNDVVSAVTVSSSYNAILYEHVDYGGTKWGLGGSASYVGDAANDKASSLRILEKCSAGSNVRLYVHWYYGGGCLGLDISVSFLPDKEFDHATGANDQTSSIIVAAGCKATLYEHAYYSGTSRTYTGQNVFVGTDMNDLPSSISISC